MSRAVLIKIIGTWNFFLIMLGCMAQCPDNIGFENGNFKNWVISKGNLTQIFNAPITTTAIDSFYRVNLIKNTYPQELDPYGLFPINSPNSSNYSIKLGDSVGYGLVQRVSYTFTIPANEDNYSIIYNYAVVLQEPGHAAWAQPSFTSKVFDVTANQYIDCGSFNFVASANLPGFQKSASGKDVYYKPWSPIAIKLFGYAGKTVRLEFTTKDCAFGPHFGYAYIDVNENCASPISGNVYCSNSNSMSLVAPPGFSSYKWYDNSYSQLLDTSNILKLNTLPAPGTNYHVIIEPYPGLGCLDTIHTTAKFSLQSFKLQTVDSIASCSSSMVDLTAAFVTAGSTTDLTFSYFNNSSLTDYVSTPKHINSAGTYYIKAENAAGCTDIKPVPIIIHNNPLLTVKNQASCGFANINTPIGFVSDQPNAINSFWRDSNATIHLASPDSIINSGTYYIKATSAFGCSTIAAITTSIFPIPYFTVAQTPVIYYPSTIDLNGLVKSTTNAGSDFSFWMDTAATLPVVNPKAIAATGIYYIKNTSTDGCVAKDSVSIVVKIVPINPPNVFSPNNDGINDTWEIPDLYHFPD